MAGRAAQLEIESHAPKLSVRIVLPKVKDAIEVGVTVRWTADTGFGVQFDGLRARDVWALGKFLA